MALRCYTPYISQATLVELAIARQDGTTAEIATMAGVSRKAAARALWRLRDMGLVQQAGMTRGSDPRTSGRIIWTFSDLEAA